MLSWFYISFSVSVVLSKVLLIAMSSGCKTFLLSPALAARGAGQSTLQRLSGDSCLLPCASLLCPAAFSPAGHRGGIMLQVFGVIQWELH